MDRCASRETTSPSSTGMATRIRSTGCCLSSAAAGSRVASVLRPDAPNDRVSVRSGRPRARITPRRRCDALRPRGIHGLPQSLYATQPLLPLFEHVFGADHFTLSPDGHGDHDRRRDFRALLAGRIALLAGKRRVIISAAFLLAAATLLAATARSLHQVIFWRFVQGVVTPGVSAVAVAYIHDRWDGARSATTTAAYVTGTVIGGFVGRVISGQAAALWSWRGSFAAVGVMSTICAFLLALRLPRDAALTEQMALGIVPEGDSRGLWSRLTSRALLGTYAAWLRRAAHASRGVHGRHLSSRGAAVPAVARPRWAGCSRSTWPARS